MKKLFHDNFDKLLACFVFLVIFTTAVAVDRDWVSGLGRDSFMILAGLLGGAGWRALSQRASTVTGDVINTPTEQNSTNLENLTDNEIDSVVDEIKEKENV